MHEQRYTSAPWLAVAAGPLLVLFASTVLATEVYRWTDEGGTVNYGTAPPPGVDAETIRADPGSPTGESPDLGRDRDNDADDESVEVEPEEPALSSSECAELEERLVMIESNPAGILVETDDGEVVRMPPEDRDDEMDQIRELLAEHCP